MKSVAIALAAGIALGGSGAWWVQSLRAGTAIALRNDQQSKQALAQAQQAQQATETKAAGRLQHAAAQQDNTHAYTQEIQRLEAGRTADAARIASLQHHLRTTATQHAQAASDAAACRDLADQHKRLAALAAEGAEMVGELGGLVKRQDVQVMLLKEQLAMDRVLIERLQ
ncbi:hypothetical protein [Comamonas aquatica]|uniref:hypothetical protein n=1 Tax=Comamonas aquatica TaxID=225991 RepID=UPI001B36BED9|nr:hypothetical protein [Comamonas aquatica]QTX22153.1 hypothetical protein KAQ61_06890 [Comamonas aquatica]